MEAGSRERMLMSQTPKPRPSVERLIRWGFAGAVLFFILCGFITTHGGQALYDLMNGLNEWALKKTGLPPNQIDGRMMLPLQILGVGFTLGAVICYYLTRGRSDE